MNFKIDLEYEDISGRNYIRTICQLFDENNNSLYINQLVIMNIYISQIELL